MTMIDLTSRLRLAADYVSIHGWTQGTEQNLSGQVCLTGGIRLCAPQTGDEYLIRAVLRTRHRAESWNDSDEMSEREVIDYLATASISDVDLADTFGPQWEQIVDFVRTSSTLTGEQIEQLAVTWDDEWDDASDTASAAAWAAGVDAARHAWDAVRATVRDHWDAQPEDVRAVPKQAVLALALRDLIGTDGFTQEHYDTLTKMWRSTVGKIHPNDADLKNTI